MVVDIVARVTRLEHGVDVHSKKTNVDFNLLIHEMGDFYRQVENKFQIFLINILYKNMKYIKSPEVENIYRIFQMIVSEVEFKKDVHCVIRTMKRNRLNVSTWDGLMCVFLF